MHRSDKIEFVDEVHEWHRSPEYDRARARITERLAELEGRFLEPSTAVDPAGRS